MRALVLGLLVLSACSAVVGPGDADAGVVTDGGVALGDAGAPGDAGVDAGVTDAGPVEVGEVRVTFAPTQATFPNPERGWYVWASDDFGASIDTGALEAAASTGVRLAYTVINLSAFRSSALPPDFLSALSNRFGALRGHGMKAVVRFVYDYSAAGNDAPASQIVSHLQQLAPVLTANADAIAVLQAGFIGAWGEWHSSKHSNSYGYMTNPGVTEAQADANRLLVRDAVLDAAPRGLPVAFRYPGDLIKWYPQPGQQARAGIHNDCWLAGPTDTGTYASEAERSYVAALSAHAMFGGETCDADAPLRSTCADVLGEGARYHLAYLNREYFAGFITAWTQGGCLDEVTRQMGYRLQLDTLVHPAEVLAGSTVTVSVALRNVGWAKLFSARPLVVTLVSGANALQMASTTLLSSLSPQATQSTELRVTLAVPASLPPGAYTVWLSAPDVFPSTSGDPRFSIRFANAEGQGHAWDAARGRFTAGTQVRVR